MLSQWMVPKKPPLNVNSKNEGHIFVFTVIFIYKRNNLQSIFGCEYRRQFNH